MYSLFFSLLCLFDIIRTSTSFIVYVFCLYLQCLCISCIPSSSSLCISSLPIALLYIMCSVLHLTSCQRISFFSLGPLDPMHLELTTSFFVHAFCLYLQRLCTSYVPSSTSFFVHPFTLFPQRFCTSYVPSLPLTSCQRISFFSFCNIGSTTLVQYLWFQYLWLQYVWFQYLWI